MKKLLLIAGVAALAACGGNDADTAETDDITTLDEAGTADAAVTTASAPGTYEVLQDGEVTGTTTINADGTYTETYADGSTMSGTHTRNAQGQICFDPDGEEDATCWTEGPVGGDGSYTVTSTDGVTATVRPATT